MYQDDGLRRGDCHRVWGLCGPPLEGANEGRELLRGSHSWDALYPRLYVIAYKLLEVADFADGLVVCGSQGKQEVVVVCSEEVVMHARAEHAWYELRGCEVGPGLEVR